MKETQQITQYTKYKTNRMTQTNHINILQKSSTMKEQITAKWKKIYYIHLQDKMATAPMCVRKLVLQHLELKSAMEWRRAK